MAYILEIWHEKRNFGIKIEDLDKIKFRQKKWKTWRGTQTQIIKIRRIGIKKEEFAYYGSV